MIKKLLQVLKIKSNCKKNDSSILLQNIQIFTAINNNYIGVAKALIQCNEENLKAKNQDNKTPLYLSIQQSKSELIDLFLSKIKVTTKYVDVTTINTINAYNTNDI